MNSTSRTHWELEYILLARVPQPSSNLIKSDLETQRPHFERTEFNPWLAASCWRYTENALSIEDNNQVEKQLFVQPSRV